MSEQPTPPPRATEERKAFWSSLPGVLTGTASVIAATVSLLALFMNRTPAPNRASPPRIETAAPAGALAASRVDASALSGGSVKGCEDAIGRWGWNGAGVVTYAEDGSSVWTPPPGQAIGPIYGRWVCVDPSAQRIVVSWQHGFTDTLTLSRDKQTISGSNQVGVQLMARRLQ